MLGEGSGGWVSARALGKPCKTLSRSCFLALYNKGQAPPTVLSATATVTKSPNRACDKEGLSEPAAASSLDLNFLAKAVQESRVPKLCSPLAPKPDKTPHIQFLKAWALLARTPLEGTCLQGQMLFDLTDLFKD